MRTAGTVLPGQALHQKDETDQSPRALRIIVRSA